VSDQVWFVARYKHDGELAWARRDGGQAITAFDDGSYAVAGSLAAGMDLTAYFAPPPGQLDLFVARYGADGTRLWARTAGGALIDKATGLARNADGSLVVSGLYQNSMVLWPGTAFETTLPVAQGSHLFLARYPADGG
jgi:hypothetical protein